MKGEEVADRRGVGRRLCHDRISGSVAARRFLRKIIMVGKSCNCFTIEATYACGLLMEGGGEVGLEGGGREKGKNTKMESFPAEVYGAASVCRL